MDLARVAALLGLVVATGCLDATGVRTRRDFEETGVVELSTLGARIDQGVVVPLDEERPGQWLRFRANAPEVELRFSSRSGAEEWVNVLVDNVHAGSEVGALARDVERGVKRLSFGVPVPASGEAVVKVGRAALRDPVGFRFAWVGDVQGGLDNFARLREHVNRDPLVEFVVFAGDITQGGSADETRDFVAAADQLGRPWYAVFGNHETSWGHGVEFQQQVGRLNVAFDYRGARFVLVDSASATLDERVWELLRGQLAGTEPKTRLVAMHVPPLDPEGLRDAGFASRSEGAKVLSLLSQGGTDLMLHGHLHTLRFGGNAGIDSVISGNGGVGISDQLDGVGMHYLAVDVDPSGERCDVGVVRVE